MGGILTTIQVLCTKWFQFKYRKPDQEPILDSEAVPDTRSEEIQPSHANTNYSISAETNANSDISRVNYILSHIKETNDSLHHSINLFEVRVN